GGNAQQAFAHHVHVEVQVADFALLFCVDIDTQVAGGYLAGDAGCVVQGLDDTLGDAPAVGQAGCGAGSDGGQHPATMVGRYAACGGKPGGAEDGGGKQGGHAEHAGLKCRCEGQGDDIKASAPTGTHTLAGL